MIDFHPSTKNEEAKLHRNSLLVGMQYVCGCTSNPLMFEDFA